MCNILLSINPEYVEQILNGTKTYEYRKNVCKRKVDKIVIYSTYPVKKIVGEVEVLDIIQMEKEELWNMTKDKSGITKNFFDKYYETKDKAVAYKLGKVIRYEEPKLLDSIGIKVAPQSYIYLRSK